MCFKPMKIKASSLLGVHEQFIPCGNCLECRKSQRASWSFRLRAELEGLRKSPVPYHVGFITLTYGTPKGGYPRDMRPTLPKELFNDEREFKEVFCFDKSHCQELFINLRAWAKQEFDLSFDTRIRYICCAEYGSLRHRPHYHALIMYPIVNGLTDEKIYNWLQHFWSSRHGFMFPKNFAGGWNGSNTEKPFVVPNLDGRLDKSALYVSKYICKDLEFCSVIKNLNINRKSKQFKNCDCFHIQSKSLGCSMIENLTDHEKLNLMLKGKCFAGDTCSKTLPLYIRDKIVFDNDYILERHLVHDENKDGLPVSHVIYKRVVRKKANQFFIENYQAIFEKKVKFYEKYIKNLADENFYTVRSVSPEIAKSASKVAHSVLEEFNSRDLSMFYLACYSRGYDVFVDKPYSTIWLGKYSQTVLEECLSTPRLNHCFRVPMIDPDTGELSFVESSYAKWLVLERACSLLFSLGKYVHEVETVEELEAKTLISSIAEPGI